MCDGFWLDRQAGPRRLGEIHRIDAGLEQIGLCEEISKIDSFGRRQLRRDREALRAELLRERPRHGLSQRCFNCGSFGMRVRLSCVVSIWEPLASLAIGRTIPACATHLAIEAP